jgi:flagellar capping protein FliD
MAEHRRVTDEDILAGFQSLHEAIALGFARIDERFARIDERFALVDDRFKAMDHRFDALEARMLRRFDDIDAQFQEMNRPRRR